MPLVRIAFSKGRKVEHRRAVSSGVHRALVETFNVPVDDLFQVLTEHEPGVELVHAPSYLGNTYTDDLTVIQITVTDSRGVEQKKKLYKRIVEHLVDDPGLRPEDVFINLLEVRKENWSFGKGEAQYA